MLFLDAHTMYFPSLLSQQSGQHGVVLINEGKIVEATPSVDLPPSHSVTAALAAATPRPTTALVPQQT